MVRSRAVAVANQHDGLGILLAEKRWRILRRPTPLATIVAPQAGRMVNRLGASLPRARQR
jgi:hypothetical protein